jgi:6-phosphogluconolactonase/glucosamine-6-phosphate isomerase/deaminase
VGQKYFRKAQQLSHGLTLGIATLMEAKQVVLIVNGKHKAEIVKEVLEGKISQQLPASLLRQHPGFAVFLDRAAARLISSRYQNELL